MCGCLNFPLIFLVLCNVILTILKQKKHVNTFYVDYIVIYIKFTKKKRNHVPKTPKYIIYA